VRGVLGIVGFLLSSHVFDVVLPIGVALGAWIGLSASSGPGVSPRAASPAREALAGLAVFGAVLGEATRLAFVSTAVAAIAAVAGFSVAQRRRRVPPRTMTAYALTGASTAIPLLLVCTVVAVAAGVALMAGVDVSRMGQGARLAVLIGIALLPASGVGALAAWVMLRGRSATS